MAIVNDIKIKITLLVDGFKRELENAKKWLENLRSAGAGAGAGRTNSAELRAASTEADKATDGIGRAKAALLSFAGTVVSFLFIKKLIETGDKWLQLTNTIRQSVDSIQDYEQALTSVIETSRKTYTSLDANAVLFAKINRALKDMGGTTSQSIFLTDIVAKLAGMETNAAGAAAGVYQLTQAIASGKFAGDEFRSVSEQLPILAATLAKGLGKSLGQLRAMSQAGELGTEEIMRGLGNQAKRVDEIFKNMPVTFSKATQNMENKWLELVGKFNESNGITQTLGVGINFLADNLQVFGEYILKFLAIGFVAGLAKMTAGLVSSAQAMRVASLEAKANAIANAQAQAAEEARLAELSATVAAREADIIAQIQQTEATIAQTQADIRSTQAMIANAASMQTRAVLAQRITVLNGELAASTALLTEQQTALNVVQTEGSLTALKLASATTLLSVGIAGLMGWELGSWLRENSTWIEKMGIRAARTAALIANLFDFSSNKSADDIRAEFEDMLNAVGDESINAIKEREEAEKHAAEVSKQGEELKVAAIQEGIKKSKDALERLNDARKTIYERDLRNLEQSEQAKIAALDNMTPARLGVEERYQSTKQVTLQKAQFSELQQLQQKTAIEIESNNQRLEIARQYNQQKLNDVEAIYSAEILSAKKRELDITGLEREANNEKKAILLELEKSYEASLSRLTQIDRQHRDKAIGYLNDINGQEQNRLNQLRALDMQGLSDAQATEQRKRQIAEDTAQIKKLIADGEYTKAVELGKKLQDLTYQQAQATKQAAAEANKARAGTGDDNAALQSRNAYNESVKLTEKALQGAADAETKQANTAKADADKQLGALEQVRAKITDIDNAISKANTLKVNVDQASLNETEAALNKAARDRTANIKVTESHAAGGLVGYSGGGYVSGAGTTTSDSIAVRLSNREFVVNADSTAKIGVDTLNHINKFGQLPKFADGGLVGLSPAGFTPNLGSGNPSSTPGETINLNLGFGAASALVTGNKAEVKNLVDAITNELVKQKRASR